MEQRPSEWSVRGSRRVPTGLDSSADRESAALSDHTVQSELSEIEPILASTKTLALQTLAFVRETLASIVRLGRQPDQTHDEGFQDPCPMTREFANPLASEATAGIEPAMKVLQTSR